MTMYDVLGLGNAIVDVEVNVDEAFLDAEGIDKGHMTLIDSTRMQSLLAAVAELPKNRCSGGSAANTIFAIQAMGLRTCYVCKVARDETGEFFVDSMTAAGVDLNTTAISVGGPEMSGTSGHCLVMITQDAERTMTTDLGVSSELGVDDVDFERLRASRYFYVEGYLSSSAASTDAAVACREAAEAGNVLVSVSLSDPSMVKFFREPLTRLLGNGVQQVFCNEEEALSWAGTDRLDVAIAELKDIAPELYVTLGAAGSIAVSGHGQQTAAGFPTKAVDTTGAGDIYAGACIAARCRGAAPLEAARFANFAAADLVAKYGARLQAESDYKRLVERFTH